MVDFYGYCDPLRWILTPDQGTKNWIVGITIITLEIFVEIFSIFLNWFSTNVIYFILNFP
jgi:hypothetical protein